ncbi:MAG: dockerin type I repeat-containing protein [Pirellulales bacterium]
MLRFAPPVRFSVVALSLLLVGPASTLSALNFVEPQSWLRGGEGSTYQEWDAFSVLPGQDNPSAAGAHPPDVGVDTVEGGRPTLQELSGVSFVTSSHNIYSFSDPLSVQIDLPNFGLGSGYFTTVVLQTKTLGTAIDPATVLLGDVAPDASTVLAEEDIGSPGGSTKQIETWFRWQLPNDPGNAASYALTFRALGSSMSLDRVSVDTWTGLEPKLEPVPGLTLLPGDANGDGKVDLTDFGILKTNFGSGSSLSQGDFNGDAHVDLTDFGILKQSFGVSGAVGVPEPATLILGTIGFALLGLRAAWNLRRRA